MILDRTEHNNNLGALLQTKKKGRFDELVESFYSTVFIDMRLFTKQELIKYKQSSSISNLYISLCSNYGLVLSSLSVLNVSNTMLYQLNKDVVASYY